MLFSLSAVAPNLWGSSFQFNSPSAISLNLFDILKSLRKLCKIFVLRGLWRYGRFLLFGLLRSGFGIRPSDLRLACAAAPPFQLPICGRPESVGATSSLAVVRRDFTFLSCIAA
jgi:hypothetical protein